MRCTCPTAAHACFWASADGFTARPSRLQPTPCAPLLTTTTRFPAESPRAGLHWAALGGPAGPAPAAPAAGGHRGLTGVGRAAAPALRRSRAASQMPARLVRFRVPWSARSTLDVPTFITCGPPPVDRRRRPPHGARADSHSPVRHICVSQVSGGRHTTVRPLPVGSLLSFAACRTSILPTVLPDPRARHRMVCELDLGWLACCDHQLAAGPVPGADTELCGARLQKGMLAPCARMAGDVSGAND